MLLCRLSRLFQVHHGGSPRSQVILRCYSSTIRGEDSNLSDRRSSAALQDGIEYEQRGAENRQWAWEKKMLAGMEVYKEKTGNVLIPYDFIMPSGDESWPQSLWGYQLGRAVLKVRRKLKRKSGKRLFSTEMNEELERIGFVQDVSQFKWDRIILPSLRHFKELYGHTDVPQPFVVPEGDDAWPKLAWGRRLGVAVKEMRAGAYASQMHDSRVELEKLEFCFTSIAERDWTEKVFPSFKIHFEEFGHCIFPRYFKVPACHPWPIKAWGIPLGRVVNQVRTRSAFKEQAARDKEKLAAIAFAWNRNEAVWNQQIMPGIRGYAEVSKNRRVPRKFVVPSEEPWPRSAWGTKLGSILSDLRFKGTYLGYFGRDADKLVAWGVNLKLSARAWQDRIVPLLDIYADSTQSGEGGGEDIPGDFVIPSEAPWPEEVWGVRLGLIVALNAS